VGWDEDQDWEAVRILPKNCKLSKKSGPIISNSVGTKWWDTGTDPIHIHFKLFRILHIRIWKANI